jgi:hypothetical protein
MRALVLIQLTLAFVLILFIRNGFAQNEPEHRAPTLQVGLSSLSFSRGNLDAALVAEIIAEKQKEVKIKLVKNMLLKKLKLDNGLFYAFIDQNIEILLTEKDEDTRVKNILENVVNLAFVVSYAEYYISTLKRGSYQWNNLRNLAESMGVDSSLFTKQRLSLLDFARVLPNSSSSSDIKIEPNKREELRNRFVGVLIDLFSEVVRQNDSLKSLGVLRTNYLQNYISMNAYLNLENDRFNLGLEQLVSNVEQELSPVGHALEISVMNKILSALKSRTTASLDSVETNLVKDYSNALKSSMNDLSKAVAALPTQQQVWGNAFNENYRYAVGAQTFNNFVLSTYNIDVSAMNALQKKQWSWLFWYLDSEFKQRFFELLLNKKALADLLFDDVTQNLSVYIKYFNLIKSFAAKGNDFEAIVTKLSSTFPCGDSVAYIADMEANFSSARNSLTNLAQLTKEEKEALEEAGSFMDKLKYVELNRFEFLRQFEEEIRPGLISLSKYSMDFLKAAKNMEGVVNCFMTTVVTDLRSVNIDLNPAFIDLFTRLDAFNRVETYAQFVNHLSDAGDVFSDNEMRKSINKILTFVRSYLKVVEDENGKLAVTVDVEGFLLNIQRLPYNKSRPFSLHFTVGANTAYFNDDLILSDNSKLRNYSFIGEKIGIKYKLYDWKYINSFSRGETFTYGGKAYIRNTSPREPAISNIHLLAYGSGLLYNLVNTGNTTNFNSPLLGVGVGLTFFNDLDFNLSVGTPLVKDKSFRASGVPDFFSFGFDIQFIEYYSRLQQKRKASQTQKKLTQAASNKSK